MFSICALVALWLPASGWAGEKRDAVMTLLNAYEAPVSQTDLQALGDGVDAELMAIAADSSVPHTRRARAVTALQYYPTAEVRTFLEAQFEGDDALLQRKAVYSLAAWGESAMPQLQAALASDDVQMRVAAARALGNVRGAAATTALRERLKEEADDVVIRAIRTTLGDR